MNHNNVIFYLTTILSASITLVLGDGENPSGGNPNGHHSGGSGGGGGGGGGSGGGLTVVIAYESLNKCSQAFFKSQLTSNVFDEFSKCNIDWKFLPCSTSKMVNGKLTCWEGEDECAVDRMFACATKLNEGNMKSVGKFVLCMHKANNELCSGQNCASQSNMDWSAIEKCSKSSEADKDCQKYWGQINDDWQITGIPGVMTPPKYSSCDNEAAKQDFKGYLCKKVQEKGISCPACGGCSGGSGGGGSGGGSGGSSGGGHHGSGSQPPSNGSPSPSNGSPPPNNGSPPPNNGSPPPNNGSPPPNNGSPPPNNGSPPPNGPSPPSGHC